MTPQRPHVAYSSEIAHTLCHRLATTPYSLRQICAQEGMPNHKTVYKWMDKYKEFNQLYHLARARKATLPGQKKRDKPYSDALAAKFIQEISLGKSISQACASDDMPHPVTISRWIKKYPVFKKKMIQAKEMAPFIPNAEVLMVGYSDKMADMICEKIATGTCSITQICAGKNMPHPVTVFEWITKHAYFKYKYELAKLVQGDHLMAEVFHIADDSTAPLSLAEKRLQIEVRKWAAGRLAPRSGTHGNSKPAPDMYPKWNKLPDWLTSPSPGMQHSYK